MVNSGLTPFVLSSYPMGLRSPVLLRQNIAALLRARGQTQKDLAAWCGYSKSWLNQILRDDRKPRPAGHKERVIHVRDLDRIADFFGVAAYQLFLPGVSAFSERRKGLERRAGTERRQGRGDVAPTPLRSLHDALAVLVRQLEDETYMRRLVSTLDEQLRAQRSQRAPNSATADRGSSGGTRPTTAKPKGKTPTTERPAATKGTSGG